MTFPSALSVQMLCSYIPIDLLFRLDLELSMLGFFLVLYWLEQISDSCMSLCGLHASHLDEHVFTEGQTGCHHCFTRTAGSSVSR